MCMAMIDEIERLGQAVEEGSMLLDDAADALSIASAGGLTRVGAASLLSNWGTARSEYERINEAARKGLTSALEDLYGR